MFTDDHIIRQIAQLVAVLKKIAGFKNAGEYSEAHAIINQNLEELFGLEAGIIMQFDVDGLAYLVNGIYGVDVKKLFILVSLLEAEGDVLAAQQRDMESKQYYQQALDLLDRFSSESAGEMDKDITAKVKALEKKLA